MRSPTASKRRRGQDLETAMRGLDAELTRHSEAVAAAVETDSYDAKLRRRTVALAKAMIRAVRAARAQREGSLRAERRSP